MEQEKESEIIAKKNKIIIKWDVIFKEVIYWLFVGILILFFDYSEFLTEGKLKATYFLSIDEARAKAFTILFIFALIFDIVLHVIKLNFFKETYKKFMIIAFTLGICYCIAVPFGQGTDEVSHFLRIYEISKKYTTIHYQETSEFSKEFVALADYQANREISYNDYKENFEAFVMNTEEKEDLIANYWNMRLYSPIQYLPQAIGVTIGRIVTDNILVIGTFGRIFGFLAWTFLCAYAIKIVPNKKTFFIVLCLLPVNIFSAICLSGDTLTNAVCMVFLAMIYRKVYLKEKISKKDKMVLILSGCLIALCKIVYLPFVFLALLLKKENFDNKKSYITFIVALIVLSCIVGLGWLVIGSNNLIESNSASKEQVRFILDQPLHYCLIVLQTFKDKGTDYIYQFTTGYELMCHGKTVIYPIISYCIGIAVILSLFICEDNKNTKLDIVRKSFVVLILLGTCALIITAIYVQWTSLFEIGMYMVAGLQGRYFIPVAILLIFIIDTVKLDIKKENFISFLLIMQLPVIGLIMSTFTH